MVRHATPTEPVLDGQRYYGVIKSYNERRGFGFVACEETARIYGRDVYLSKEEASQLIKEPIVSGAVSPAKSLADEGQPPLKEGDFVSFQVQKSTEGYPQAMSARRLRRLRGSVLQGTLPRDGGEGKIVVKGDGKEGVEATAEMDAELRCLMGAEVRVRQTDCGQLRLVPGDEVIFCCQASCDGAADGLGLEAQLVELLWTPRTAGSGSGSILGCFQLELPRTPEPAPEGEEPKPTGAPVLLDGHALVDRVVLAGLPNDLEAPELMRLFSKLGAGECVVTCPDCDVAHICRFATISFSGPVDVARMLVRAAHTINAQGCTQLARLLTHRDEVVALPALPVPALTAEGTALLVQWQQVGLAAGYLVELRPKGAEAPWASVGVASGKLEDSENLPEGLLGPQCAACRVNCISAETPYEARVTYFTSWGCRSQASAASLPCSLAGGASTAAPQAPPAMPSASAVPSTGAEQPSLAPLLPASMIGGSEAEARSSNIFGTDPSNSMPFAFPAEHGPLLSVPGSSQLPQNLAAAAAIAANGPGWRCAHGGIIPPPAAPELVPYEEASRSVCIQWPTVVHATAYTVELLEEGTSAAERFTRAVPEILPEALVELRVGNLNPGAYAACVRCVAPCGCESAPSTWSFLPPFWVPPPPASLGLSAWQPQVGSMQPLEPSTAGLPGAAANSQSLLSTNPSAAQPHVPPPPSAPPSWPAATLGSTAQSPGAAEDEALVLD